MKVALAQINARIGDLAANEAAHARALAEACAQGAEIVVFPEMSLLGYPPRDLVERHGVAEACIAAAERLARAVPAGVLALVGLPTKAPLRGRPLQNAIALLRGGRVEGFAAKQLLPTYDVFDEDRHFAPASRTTVVDHAGERVAVLLCEDLWQAGDAGSVRCYDRDPVAEARALGATILCVSSASPFVAGKDARHVEVLAARARASKTTLVSVNAVGGHDDLVFDGGSRVLASDGSVVAEAPRFAEAVLVVETARAARVAPHAPDLDAERFHAIVLGVRDYLAKTGHKSAILGLSGGIDSALVAAIAAAAIGPSSVTGILMPSRYSSDGSVADAQETARRLGLGRIETLPIDAMHRAVESTVAAKFATDGLAGENLQSRARGLLVMLASNATGAIVLTTGNKSEYAAGYATLYGDMNGGLAPIGDLYKTEVYAMARMLNARHAEFGFAAPPIPEASIEKAPSAELRPNQTDQDSLPPYEVLDAVLRVLVDAEGSVDEAVAATGAARDLVLRIARMLDRAQFKRDQAAVIVKLSPRAFGRGRRYPIAQGWGWGS
ncbi:MAG: NAD+ synthase [Planctomycetaceae bacterium]|nr:NAD+ synthase [Planctomycetaceae bacterium]